MNGKVTSVPCFMKKSNLTVGSYPFSAKLNADGVHLDIVGAYGASAIPLAAIANKGQREVGQISYELSNHLGNVLAVVSDRKFAVGGGTVIVNETFTGANNTGDFIYTGTTLPNQPSNDNGKLKFTTNQLWAGVTKDITTVPGESYFVEFDFEMNPNHPTIQGCGFAVKDVNYNTLNQSWTNQDGHVGLVFRAAGTTSKFYVYTGNPNLTTGDYWIDNLKITTVAHYEAEILMSADYQAYGGAIEDRQFASESYRYGFNGKEKDDENFEGSYDFGARIYNSQIGRFLSTDPKEKEYPFMSPYVYAVNNPIRWMDVNGEGPGDGVRNMYVVRVQIGLDRNDKPVYKYFGKYYYSNITNDLAKQYETKGVKGWFEVSERDFVAVCGKDKYTNGNIDDVVHDHVISATGGNDLSHLTNVDGADDIEKVIGEWYVVAWSSAIPTKYKTPGGDATIPGQLRDNVRDNPIPSNMLLNSATLRFNNSSAVDSRIVVSVYDETTGATRVVYDQIVKAGEKASYDYNIDASKEHFVFSDGNGGDRGVDVKIIQKERKSDERAPDTIQNYGSEEPSQDVIDELLQE